MNIPPQISPYLDQVTLPEPNSHKGQNGKLLIIGGSKLFHAASKWSLDIASRFVDMVFYSSVPSNNELLKEAKANFWDGIVVPLDGLADYIDEADSILIGPGMEREQETAAMVNKLIYAYPHKKWVVDAGALQMVDLDLLNANHIVTPHQKEYVRLQEKWQQAEVQNEAANEVVNEAAATLASRPTASRPTVLLKGSVDIVFSQGRKIKIEGGNAGMTKGGTGDVLAGLVAALYCTHPAVVAAVVASFINKKAGDALYEKVGPYFNASDLVAAVPKVAWELVGSCGSQ